MAVIRPKKKVNPTKKVEVKRAGKPEREVEIPVAKNREIQDGITPKGKVSNTVPEGKATIGTQIGITLNMGDFQSARIDVFIQRNVDDNPKAIQEGYNEISEMLHDELARQTDLLE